MNYTISYDANRKAIITREDGVVIPQDPQNIDYQEFLTWNSQQPAPLSLADRPMTYTVSYSHTNPKVIITREDGTTIIQDQNNSDYQEFLAWNVTQAVPLSLVDRPMWYTVSYSHNSVKVIITREDGVVITQGPDYQTFLEWNAIQPMPLSLADRPMWFQLKYNHNQVVILREDGQVTLPDDAEFLAWNDSQTNQLVVANHDIGYTITYNLENKAVINREDGASIPVDIGNRHYREFLEWNESQINPLSLSDRVAPLSELKAKRCNENDANTTAIIDGGFSFGGQTFSLSGNAQMNWTNMMISASMLSYPLQVPTKNDGVYTLTSPQHVQQFYATGIGHVKSILDAGRAKNLAIMACQDEASLNAIV